MASTRTHHRVARLDRICERLLQVQRLPSAYTAARVRLHPFADMSGWGSKQHPPAKCLAELFIRSRPPNLLWECCGAASPTKQPCLAIAEMVPNASAPRCYQSRMPDCDSMYLGLHKGPSGALAEDGISQISCPDRLLTYVLASARPHPPAPKQVSISIPSR